MKVLVTSAGSVLGQAIIKSLKIIKRFDLEIHTADPNPNAAGFYMGTFKYFIEYANSNEYIPNLKKLLKMIQPEVVFVGTDVELLLISKAKNELESTYNTKIIVSDPSVIEMADDKYKTYQYLTKIGFGAPKTLLLEDFNSADSQNFPLILKPRIGARSIGVYLIQNQSELKERCKLVNQPIVQEYLSMVKEYTAGVLYFDDNNYTSIVMERTLKDGNTFTAIPLPYCWINESLEKLTKIIKPFGPINYQFKIEGTQIKIFEINARYSGTTFFRCLANVNEVEMTLLYLSGKVPIKQPKITFDIKILRYYEEIVIPIENDHPKVWTVWIKKQSNLIGPGNTCNKNFLDGYV